MTWQRVGMNGWRGILEKFCAPCAEIWIIIVVATGAKSTAWAVRRDIVISIPAFYSGGLRLKSRPGDWLYDSFRGLPQSIQANTGMIP
jgi:hypothetical protein